MLTASTPAHWIDAPFQLDNVARSLQPGLPLALDTEADSLHHYQESVCLVTVRQGAMTLLLDSLQLRNLSAFWAVAEKCEWILHGADFDLRMLRRLGAPEPTAVFDTMIAAQLCGLTGIGYAALVQQFFGVNLSKASQREDWSLRPLTTVMLDYAAQDVNYLEELRLQLTDKLQQLGRLSWHQQSSFRVLQSSKILKEIDPDQIWRITGVNKLQPAAQTIAKELWRWREEEARAQDVPPFKVLVNDRLLELADWVEAHRTARHLPGFLLPRHCCGGRLNRLKEALQRGQTAPPLEPLAFAPRAKRDPAFERRTEKLKEGRDALAKNLLLDPSLIASKAVLFALAQGSETAATSLLSENRWCRWQWELLQPIVTGL